MNLVQRRSCATLGSVKLYSENVYNVDDWRNDYLLIQLIPKMNCHSWKV